MSAKERKCRRRRLVYSGVPVLGKRVNRRDGRIRITHALQLNGGQIRSAKPLWKKTKTYPPVEPKGQVIEKTWAEYVVVVEPHKFLGIVEAVIVVIRSRAVREAVQSGPAVPPLVC